MTISLQVSQCGLELIPSGERFLIFLALFQKFHHPVFLLRPSQVTFYAASISLLALIALHITFVLR